MKNLIPLLVVIFYSCVLLSQENTIGLLYHDLNKTQEGYTLFNPENQSIVYLINNCGQVVHTWGTDEIRVPGKEQYLDNSGRLYLASAQPLLENPSFGAGGSGGVVEILSWNGDIEYRKVLADSLVRQHHDIHVMPNGNVMAIVWQNVSLDDAASFGFDTLSNPQIGFWPDKIIEIDPSNDSVIWEWNSIDHMVQDLNSDLNNFGVIEEHPELININYIDFAFGRQDVHHINSIDYNSDLDQILLSVRNFNEVWIIDHSTTSLEASTHSGGNSGRGGDILYRWGNPAAYNSGGVSDQKLFRQHDASWIIDVNHPINGGILCYNNFIAPELSLGNIFIPEINALTGDYILDENDMFLPAIFSDTINHPEILKTFSTAASNIQLQPNGNYMMCAGRQGRIFEVTSDGELVWEYLVPMRNGFSIEQGEEIALSENFTFSGRKYQPEFEGFIGKDLSPKGFIELEPNEAFCELVNIEDVNINSVYIFPNPVSGYINFKESIVSKIIITNSIGQVVKIFEEQAGVSATNVSDLEPGLYILNVIGRKPIKFIKL
ncbi:MAG: hypothetical protein ACI86M_000664 [Saprospiraceae bacterium]|jgi:hypothetical protein